jgi:hypothetical protein
MYRFEVGDAACILIEAHSYTLNSEYTRVYQLREIHTSTVATVAQHTYYTGMRHSVSLFLLVVVSSACVAGKVFKKSDLEAAAKQGTCSSCKTDAPEGGFGVKQKRRGADGPMIPNAPTERIAT